MIQKNSIPMMETFFFLQKKQKWPYLARILQAEEQSKGKCKTQMIWSIQAKNYNNSLHRSGKGCAWENQFIAINNYRYKHVRISILKEFSYRKLQKPTDIIWSKT